MSQKVYCLHCGKNVVPATLREHMKAYLEELGRSLADDTNVNLNPGPNLAGIPPVHNVLAVDALNAPAEEEGDKSEDDTTQIDDVMDEHPPTLPETFAPVQGLRRNPPVTIQDWPEIDLDVMSDTLDTQDIPGDDPNRDPNFIEQAVPPRLDPIDEPWLNDEEARRLTELEYGDLDEDEWIDIYNRTITSRDRTTLWLLATRLRSHFSRQTYDDLRQGACAELKLPSEFTAYRRLRILSGLETRKYQALTACPFCKQNRFNTNGTARRSFRYTPLIPQLCGLFQDAEMAEKLLYRVKAEQTREVNKIVDVFDAEHYRSLRQTLLDPETGYHFFDNPQDLALGLSTDGLTLFKRRRRGLSTAWLLIIINYNLPPKIRNRLEKVICVSVIPGPKQCKDLNSFLIPLLEELLELETGVSCPSPPSPGREGHDFILRAFLIILFGDIPAVAKMLMMKGHNAIKPCRACMIKGVLCHLEHNSVYYVPLADPDDEDYVLTFEDLELRTHEGTLRQLQEIESQRTQTASKKLAQHYGLNARSIFTRLRSINLATCAPYDAMHLLFENLVPNMIKHWTGKFKGLDEGDGTYRIVADKWLKIGLRTVAIRRTVPSAFVSVMHDIAQDGDLFTAELYAFWIQYVAPIVLEDTLSEEYYNHFLLMRDIIVLSIQLEITHDKIDKLQRMVNEWVADYELYYYQYKASRLPACPLTIHALLHMPMYIRQTGPLWASWAFVMERFCGQMLPAVKNRTRPYEHLDNWVQRCAQMQIVSCLYSFPSLRKPTIRYSYANDERISSHEKVYPDFPEIVLGRLVTKNVRLDDPEDSLEGQIHKYFATVYATCRYSATDLRSRIDEATLVRYGRFRMTNYGDSIRTKKCIDADPSYRDNSFVRYDLLPDRNTAFRNLPDVMYRRTYYGQVLDIYYVEFVTQKPQPATENEPEVPRKADSYLLVRIRECETGGHDATNPESRVVKYSKMQTPEIIHINTISAVVGRINLDDSGREWAIIDRSSSGARTQFVDQEGNEFD